MVRRNNNKQQAFISHNSKQKRWVREVVEQWRALGLQVFFDEDSIEIGEDITSGIERGLKASRYVVFVITPESLKSHWVGLETAITIYDDPDAQKNRLIPILLEPVDKKKIRAAIKRLNWVDLTHKDAGVRRTRYHMLLKKLGVKRRVLPDPPSPDDKNGKREPSKSFQITDGGKVLAIGSHWDDILLGCFGTLLKLRLLYGYEVTLYVLCTNYQRKYYGVEQFDLENKVAKIFKIITERFGIKCFFAEGTSPEKRIEDRRFRDKSSILHLLMKDIAHEYEDHNLILTPPMDDGHEDHAFTGQLVFSYFRRTHQTILEYEIKRYTEKGFIPNIFVNLDDTITPPPAHKKLKVGEFKASLLSDLIVRSPPTRINGSSFLFGVESLKARLITKALDYSGDKNVMYGEAFRGKISI